MTEKLEKLKESLAKMKSVLIAYSGGVDSTFLLKVASNTFNHRVLAVTADSATFPIQEREFTKKIAKELKVRHMIIRSDELKNPNYLRNEKDRCYWCKKDLFTKLLAIAKKESLKHVIDGSNFDDKDDFRPGMKAAQEIGVRSPLKEAELRKEEIRKYSYQLGLPTWNKPSFACLASRLPYGVKIKKEILKKIDNAEQILKEKGFKQVRVRNYRDIARIEVSKEEIPRLMERNLKDSILHQLKKLNYSYITLDLEGYRGGSMNETMKISSWNHIKNF